LTNLNLCGKIKRKTVKLQEAKMSTFDKVAKLISSQLGIDKEKVKPESLIVADLGADSIDVFEMVMALEDELGIEINEDKVQELKTVQDVVNIIENN